MKVPKVNLEKLKSFFKRFPEFVATHAFLFFFFIFSFEAFLGFHLYHKFCFPEVKPSKSSLKFDKEKFKKAVVKIEKEKEELEKIPNKDYFHLFSLERVEAPSEERSTGEESSEEAPSEEGELEEEVD